MTIIFKFKDKCDNCNQMKICKGYKGKVLCEECISKKQAESFLICSTYPDRDKRYGVEWRLAQKQVKPKEVVYEQTKLDLKT